VFQGQIPSKPLIGAHFLQTNRLFPVQDSFPDSSKISDTFYDKILRPKIQFFQMSGFQGYELCSFISKSPSILTHSLKRTLVPSVEAIWRIVCDQKDFILVLQRCGWILPKNKRFMENVVFLERGGILGTHLALVLKLHPRLFLAPAVYYWKPFLEL